MEYRKGPGGEPISILGYGCMRFTKKSGKGGGEAHIGIGSGGIDLNKAEAELRAAIDAGVNYLDTAYIYQGSEMALGQILRKSSLRDKVNLATKLPHYLVKSVSMAERFFQEQLSRLQTDHVEYYLMHMINDIASWEKLCRMGIKEWIAEKKESGQIRHIGFSYHGNTEMFLKILDAYDWDFCQIQYNYMDEYSQAGRPGLEEAGRRGIPVMIMEPLRGGSLTDRLPPAARMAFEGKKLEDGHDLTPAALGFRWLWDQPEVTCVLSGMHSTEMVEENCRLASMSPVGCCTQEEKDLVQEVKAAITASTKVGCTGCGYCMPCPMGVDIPGTFHYYNLAFTDKLSTARMEYLRNTLLRKDPSGAYRCIGCGKCETHCPQHLSISKELKDARKVLETPAYNLGKKALKLFKLW